MIDKIASELTMLILSTVAVLVMHDWLLAIGLALVLPITWWCRWRERLAVRRVLGDDNGQA